MTRNDYKLIAEALRQTKPDSLRGTDTYVTVNRLWGQTVISIADALATDNSRFKYNRFYDACGGI
jgi:hypothetical protein